MGPSNFSVSQSLNLWNLEFNNLDLDFGLDNNFDNSYVILSCHNDLHIC